MSTPVLASRSRPIRSASCCDGRSAGRTGAGGGTGTGPFLPGHTWAQAWPGGHDGIGQSGSRAAADALAVPVATPAPVHVVTPSEEEEHPSGWIINVHWPWLTNNVPGADGIGFAERPG